MPEGSIESKIKQIEKYIEDNRRFLKKKEASTYDSFRKQHNQSHNEEENENYLGLLGKLECIVRNKNHSETFDELHQNLNKTKETLKECVSRIDEIEKENRNHYRRIQKLSNAYKEQKRASIIFTISAVVLVALVCYVTFFHLTCPGCILDDAVVKQNVAALVNSAI